MVGGVITDQLHCHFNSWSPTCAELGCDNFISNLRIPLSEYGCICQVSSDCIEMLALHCIADDWTTVQQYKCIATAAQSG